MQNRTDSKLRLSRPDLLRVGQPVADRAQDAALRRKLFHVRLPDDGPGGADHAQRPRHHRRQSRRAPEEDPEQCSDAASSSVQRSVDQRRPVRITAGSSSRATPLRETTIRALQKRTVSRRQYFVRRRN